MSAARAGVVVLVLAAGASCGARTGLYADPYQGPDAALTVFGLPDAGEAGTLGVSPSCAAGIAREASSTIDAGTMCMAGPQLLECDVASTGTHVFPNYCVTSADNCSAVDNSSCIAQCASGEFGVVCSDLTVPNVGGCRLIYPAAAAGGAGLAFCCTCDQS